MYRAASDSRLLGGGYDMIADFQTGLDKLDLTALGITAGRVAILSGGGSTTLYADVADPAGYGVTDLAISFTGANAIQVGDILF